MQLTDAPGTVSFEVRRSANSDPSKTSSDSPSNEWSAVFTASFSVTEEANKTNFDQPIGEVKLLTFEFLDELIPNDQFLGVMVPGFDQQTPTRMPPSTGQTLIASGLSIDGDELTQSTLGPSNLAVPTQAPTLNSFPQGLQVNASIENDQQETWSGKIDMTSGLPHSPEEGSASGQTGQSQALTSMESTQETQSANSKPPAQQVLDVTIDQIATTQKGEAKSLTFQLHPAELGQVTVVIDWSADSINAKILVAEFGTRDLLLQGQQELVQALEEIDVGLGELEIGLQNSQQETEPQHRRPTTKLVLDHPEEQTIANADPASVNTANGAVNVIV